MEQVAPSSHTTPKLQRSASDSQPLLYPSPKIQEQPSEAKDDNALIVTPLKIPSFNNATKKRLALHMPDDESSRKLTKTSAGLAVPSNWQEPRETTYSSPTSVLPRHSRGMDFARACTNLHHSTLVDHATPDSSPTITNKKAIIPSRRQSSSSMVLDSPRISWSSSWMNGGNSDRGLTSRSIGSTTALTSEASSSDSERDDIMTRLEDSDEMVTTPQARKSENGTSTTPYGTRGSFTLGAWTESQSPIARGLTHVQRNRIRKSPSRSHRHHNSHHPLTNVNSSLRASQEAAVQPSISRRESLAFGTDNLHISSSNESGEEGNLRLQRSTTPSVIRRPVVRRSNLLPKTKGFARIRAQLQEENTPLESEVKKEAEVVNQVRVKDVGLKEQSTSSSSPDLKPTILPDAPAEEPDTSESDSQMLNGTLDPVNDKPPDERRGSTNKEFLPQLYTGRTDTPPPPLFHRPRSVSGQSEDVNMDSPFTFASASNAPNSIISTTASETKPDSETDQPSRFQPPTLPLALDVSRKIRKRRREEDFDPASIKRRAVSPGMSVQSSPVLGQSPASSTGGWWGQAKANRENSVGTSTSASEERSGSMSTTGIATPSLGPKRVGMQGYADTNDGLMKMTLE